MEHRICAGDAGKSSGKLSVAAVFVRQMPGIEH